MAVTRREFHQYVGFSATAFFLGPLGCQYRGAPPPAPSYADDWESLRQVPIPDWFNDDKFGVFIHWGAYSVIGHRKGGRGYSEHVPKEMYADPEYYYPYLERRFGASPPELGYKDIVAMFKAEHWDPDAWASLFVEAGAKYVVLTAEHHDGYALWDSQLTEWCATKIGPMRDLVGDLGEAVRSKGLRYAPSYHRERHTGFFAQDKYKVSSPARPDVAEEIRRVPNSAGLYGPFTYSDDFIQDYVARWKEIQDNYKPDFMWLDDIPIFYWTEESRNHPQTQKFHDACRGMIMDYLNDAAERGQPVYLNNKGRHLNWPEGVGCLEKDNLRLDSIGPKWQNPATLGTSYGYMAEEEENDAYKSPTELIHLLCDVVSKNGNLLLNIGPRADGTIPEGMQIRLRAIGTWLGQNGEAIYGTRPWIRDHQQSPQIYFTAKTGHFYATLIQKANDPFVIRCTLDELGGLPSRIILLGSDRTVSWQVIEGGIEITPPHTWPGDHAWVFKVELADR